MKPLVATAGDTVKVSTRGVSVNGRLLPNRAAMPFDTNHRPLQHWPFGAYRVAPGTVWVISSFNSRSFDSRPTLIQEELDRRLVVGSRRSSLGYGKSCRNS